MAHHARRRHLAVQPGQPVAASAFSGSGLSLHVFACDTYADALGCAREAGSQVRFGMRADAPRELHA